jgi:hypothetical protein
MQWRFSVRAEPAVGVHISSGSDQTLHYRRAIRKVPRPVGRRVEQRSVAGPVADARRREPWIRSEHPLERCEVACLYDLRGRDGTWIICRHQTYKIIIIYGGAHDGQRTGEMARSS